MVRTIAICALLFALMGCDGSSQRVAEIRAYVEKIQQLDALNQRVDEFITRLDQTGEYEITEADLHEARRLIVNYVAEIQKIPSSDIVSRELRVTHDLYGRKLAEANNLAVDSGRELRRERGNVAIAMRHLEKMTKQHYQAIDVLWLRANQPDELPLKWPGLGR